MADKTIPALKILRGNVGINTATPAFKIDVDGSAVFRGAAGWAGNDNQACAIYLNTAGRGVMGNFANYARNLIKANSQYVEVGQNSTLVYGIKFRVGSNAANGFMFESNISGSMTTLMNIRGNDGNVGIGVAGAPAKKLEVNFTGDDGIQIQNTGSSHASIWLDGGTGGVGGAYLRMTSRDGTNTMTHWINLQSNGNLVFRPAATGTAANQIIFNQNGSVGVGGTPPSNYKFYVNGTSYFSGNVTLAGNSTSRFYFGNKLAIEGQISNNNLDLGENFANIRMRSSSDVFPTNSVNLGTSSNRWTTIYGAAGDFSSHINISNDYGVVWGGGTGRPYIIGNKTNGTIVFGEGGSEHFRMNTDGNVGINTTSPAYKLDVYGGDARVGTNLRLGNGSAAGNSTDPAITVSGVTTAGVYFQNSGVGFGAGSGSKYLFLSSAGNASLGGNGFFKQLGDRPYGTDNLNDYYRSNDEASFCQFYRYDSTHGHWANSSGTLTTNAPSTLTQPTSSIYSYGALFTLRSISSFRGQFYFAHSASEFYWRSGWGTNGDQNWTRIVGDRNIQSVIHNVGHISTKAGNNLTVGGSITVQPGSGDGILFLKNSGASQILRLDQNSIRTTTNTQIVLFTNGNSNQLYLSSGGNVGIGTNTPNGLLNVAGNTKIGTAGSPYSGTNVTSLTINGVYPALSLGHTSNRFTILAYSTYTNYETVSNAHHVFSGGNVGVSTTSPGATLDVKQGTTNNNNKLMKVADDVLSVYKVTGLSNHTVTLTCGSYFQAEVVITANQTNGGTYNNLYIRGIWSNNHHSHHWDEIENIGSLTGSSFSIAVSANDVSNSGKLVITHTYSSGSFSQMVVRVTDLYGSAHSYSIT